MLHQRLQGGQLFPAFHKADGPAANDALVVHAISAGGCPAAYGAGAVSFKAHIGVSAQQVQLGANGGTVEIQRQALRPGGHTKVQRNKVRHAGCRVVDGNAADGALFQNGKLALQVRHFTILTAHYASSFAAK